MRKKVIIEVSEKSFINGKSRNIRNKYENHYEYIFLKTKVTFEAQYFLTKSLFCIQYF